MTLTLPFPPSALLPNRARGLHWAKKGRIASEYRQAVGWTARTDWGRRRPLRPPVTLAVMFVVADNRRRDVDNLVAAFKAGLDGLVDAGVIVGDHWQGLTISYTVERGTSAHVRIEVT